MNHAKANSTNLLLEALGLLALGALILWGRTAFYRMALFATAGALALSSLARLTSVLLRRSADATPYLAALSAALGLGLLITLLLLPQAAMALLPLAMAVSILFNGLVKLVTYCNYRKNRVHGRFLAMVDCLFYLAFGVLLLFAPLLHLEAVLIVIGVYCMLLGVTCLRDFVREILPPAAKVSLKRRLRVGLPVLFAAFIPYRMLSRFNRYLASQPPAQRQPETFAQVKSGQAANLEVLFHVMPKGSGAIGHLDLCLDGRVISYGNYDDASTTLFGGMGDGVLLFADKGPYLNYCIHKAGKTIFSFGLALAPAQKQRVERQIRDMAQGLLPWLPPIRRGEGTPPFLDTASRLYRDTRAEFYKFRSGKFKSYFVLSTNCCLLADSIIGPSGVDLLKISGIIAPGTYYDYLEGEFRQPHGMVVSRQVYAASALPG